MRPANEVEVFVEVEEALASLATPKVGLGLPDSRVLIIGRARRLPPGGVPESKDESSLAESKSVIVGSCAGAGAAAVDSVEFDERPSRHYSYRAALSSGAGFGGKVPGAKRPESRLGVLLHAEAKTASLGGIVSKSQHVVTNDDEAKATPTGGVVTGVLRSKYQNVVMVLCARSLKMSPLATAVSPLLVTLILS